MSESFAAYRRRVLGYLGKRDPEAVLADTPQALANTLASVPASFLASRAEAGRWSIVEIAGHLADAELAFGWRIRNVLATPGVRLPWWDENLWSEKLGYARMPLSICLSSFAAQRAANLAVLRSVPHVAFVLAFGVHERRGRQTLGDLVALEAAHDLNHLRQIRRLLDRRPLTKGACAIFEGDDTVTPRAGGRPPAATFSDAPFTAGVVPSHRPERTASHRR
jgi:hypothetical protein